MKIPNGKIVGGNVVPEDVSLHEGLLGLTPEQEAELLLSVAEADRGETVSADEVLTTLSRRLS